MILTGGVKLRDGMRIMFFIESLRSGGKERRLIELINYLNRNTNCRIFLILTQDKIQYDLKGLDLEIRIIKRKYLKKDPFLFLRFYRLCSEIKPDIIHTWGSMLAFYALPVVLFKRIPHINGHITNAPLNRKRHGFQFFITSLGFQFSSVILANSYAGLRSYGVSGEKCRVIYNGLRMDRFANLPEKEKIRSGFNITTPYSVIMVASFTSNKNYRQFIDVACLVSKLRDDITFVGVGDTEKEPLEFERIREYASKTDKVLLIRQTSNVEALVNACDIGVLFTYSEGISNAVLEYMACGKPAIVNDAGGSAEIIKDRVTGFLLRNETNEEVASIIIDLINDVQLRDKIGRMAKSHVAENFSVDRMGKETCRLYSEVAKTY